MSKVSVVIPVYNGERFIKQAVKSVLNQTHTDFELIVVNDGSTDQTEAVLVPWMDRIRYLKKENGGTASALNAGIRLATGEWFAWLSADDIFYPDKLKKQVAFFKRHPHCDLVYTDYHVINSQGRKLYRVRSPYYENRRRMIRKLLDHCFINGSTVMARIRCFRESGLFNETLPFVQDYEMWLRLVGRYSFGHIAEPLGGYRKHATNRSHHPDAVKQVPVIQKRARKRYQSFLR
jgi:teichuronic acid biosynthesis glycosyltransferase TuaG